MIESAYEKSLEVQLLEMMNELPFVQTKNLEDHGIPRVMLTRLVRKGLIARVGPGLYRSPNGPEFENESLSEVARRVPRAVFCLLTALEFHHIGTSTPNEVWISLPKGSHAPSFEKPPTRMSQFSDASFLAGIEKYNLDGIEISVYSKGKTVADCFKYRNQIGIDVAVEALRDVRERNLVSVDELLKFAKVCRVEKIMTPYLEMLS